MKHYVLAVLVMIICQTTKGQTRTTIPLPQKVKHGKLENGMQYFILRNENPKGKVSFYFTQKVGAILEEDHEDGLAHFLEHMAFNGSENFPDSRGIDKYLESKGFVLGEQYNAFTNWEQTQYYVAQVPANDNDFINKVLIMLRDWSGSLLLNDNDIDNERGVIAGEWRERQSAQLRLREKTWSGIYNNTKYAERDVMGDISYINSFDPQVLRDFYKKWYRPDLQAVIVVGDINVADMEKKVKNYMGKIPKRKNIAERPYIEIPKDTEVNYLLATEKSDEISNININVLFRKKEPKIYDKAYLKDRLIRSMFFQMLSRRYQQVVNSEGSSSKSIRANYAKLAVFDGANSINITPRKGSELRAVATAFRELERIKRFGFTKNEFSLVRKNYRTSYENRVDQEKDRSNSYWAQRLVSYFNEGTPLMTARASLTFLNNTLPEVSLEEINNYVLNFENINESTIVVSGPEDITLEYPRKEKIVNRIIEARKDRLKNYVDNLEEIRKRPLVSKTLKGDKIQSKFDVEGITKAQGYTLANGVRVILMPSEEENSTISMQAVSPGGLASVETEDMIFLDAAIALVRSSGLGDFKASDLSKKMTGKSVRVNLSYREFYDVIRGTTPRKNLEDLLQLVYLYFEEPRFSKTVFDTKKSDWKDQFEQFSVNNENQKYYDAINMLYGNSHPRTLPVTSEKFDALTFEKCKALYLERFSDANDFNFIFTGNFVNEEILPLLQKYLGNLSIKPTSENFVDHGIQHAKGISIRNLNRPMEVPKTTLYFGLVTDNITFSQENFLISKLVESMLYTRYLSTLREDAGGTYGANVQLTLKDIPKPQLDMFVELDCDPGNKDVMLRIIKEELQKLATDGSFAPELENAKKYLIDTRKEDLETNFFWESEMINTLLFQRKYISIEDYEAKVNSISLEKIQNFVKTNVLSADVIEVSISPDNRESK